MASWSRLIFWEYQRETWQWWVIVAMILAFIFLTPRDVFHDQPKAASIVMLSEHQFWLEPNSLDSIPEANRAAEATKMIQARFKNKAVIADVEPVMDENEEQVTGYTAYAKP